MSEIAKIAVGLNLDDFDLDTFDKHYSTIINKYKKIGSYTMKSFKNDLKTR